MVELTELLHASQAEIDARNEAVEAVTQAVTGIWPSATVQVFGSFATGGVPGGPRIMLRCCDSRRVPSGWGAPAGQ
jgi:hypothetical protein